MQALRDGFKAQIYLVVGTLQMKGYFRQSEVDRLPSKAKDFLNSLLRETLKDEDVPLALYRMTELLWRLYAKQVIVLIDEYDTPTSHAVDQGYLEEASKFFKMVFTSLLKVCLPAGRSSNHSPPVRTTITSKAVFSPESCVLLCQDGFLD